MELTATALQTVPVNDNVVFTNTAVPGSQCIMTRQDSGLVTLRGMTNQCRARFKVSFGANMAIPEGGTVEAISAALAINGESLASTQMIVTPAAAEEFFNIGRTVFIDVPSGCCTQISVENTSTQPINIQNANIIVERVA